MNNDRLALTAAFETIARTSEQERLHRAATDIHNPDSVNELRELVNSNFFANLRGAQVGAQVESQEDRIEIDERLRSLVVDPINALPEAKRTVKGRVRSGEEIANAIPDVAAFLNEVTLQSQHGVLLDFFELNETGQLVMKDYCPEAYGQGENALQARMRQTRIVYRGEDGQTKVMTGEEYFKVTKRDEKSRPLEMEVSEAARKIDQKSILMARGLPTLKWDGEKHTGEYARMNTGQLERATATWTDDHSVDGSHARNACCSGAYGHVNSLVDFSNNQADLLGSRGVLRVNLNLEWDSEVEPSLDEAGIQKVRALFESRESGYEGYALQLLRKGKIDPENLPEGSAPLWESPEAALNELLANLNPAVLEKIDRDVTTPAIVIEPIMSHEAVYVRDHETKDYDRRVVGDTPFYVSEWAAKDLNKANQRNKVGSTDGERIVGWRIGIADKAQVTKTLESDGDVSTKKLEDRAKDFHGKGGHGTLGFVSAVDHPVLYGLMMNESRSEDTKNPIDDVQASNGVWTMGTRVDNSGPYPRVAGGFWSCDFGRADLNEVVAYVPSNRARVRLAVMFNKS